ncbi:hypothetical protein [Nonomuraea sp. NPDC049400]|uniref:hypothetical protein n=1 Tax=Nonomuraea sp. NPDC049400 TaxID=3364352 RepID=UPI00378AFCB9
MDPRMERIHRFASMQTLLRLLESLPTEALPTHAVKVVPSEDAAVMNVIAERLRNMGRSFTDQGAGTMRTIIVDLGGGFTMRWEAAPPQGDDADPNVCHLTPEPFVPRHDPMACVLAAAS